jgi:cytochrome bd-type quinol oxidase subunit 1
MDGVTKLNDQVLDAVRVLQAAPLTSSGIQAAGAGKAYQSVAQSAAIAVQDATDNLRNVNTIGMTAMGVAIAQLLATGDQKYAEAIQQANTMMTGAAELFKTVGQNAAVVLSGFPSGGGNGG